MIPDMTAISAAAFSNQNSGKVSAAQRMAHQVQ
jgi:hypothetical protein